MSIGKSKPHDSARHHVTGTATYTDDQRAPDGLLVCWPVLSSHAHANILKINVQEALTVKGVLRVLTADDVLGENNTGPIVHDEELFPRVVQYWGQPIVWVVAETADAARQGAAKVSVDYDPLEPILTMPQAIDQNSFHGDAQRMHKGDTAAALNKSAHVLEGEVEVGGQDHFYLETHTSWAIPDTEGNMQVYSSTQHPTETQIVVARVLGVASHRVVVTSLRMGGGFGGKETQANPFAAIAALAAQKTGRPAKVRLKRHQDMQISGKRHPMLGKYRVGFSKTGKLEALDLDIYSDGGYSTDLSQAVMQRAMFHSDNSYFIPHMDVRGHVCKTHKTSQTAFRGFGGPQGMVIIEDIMARVAGYLGIEPEVLREQNFYKDGDETHYGQQLQDVRLARVWSELKESSGFETQKAAINTFNQRNQLLKRGIALTPVKFGISFTTTFLNQAGAFVLIYADGSIQVNHGGTEMGQGLHIKMLQVAAQTLGLPLDRFRMMPTATDKVPNTSATAASSGSDLNGQAVKNACETLKLRLATVAAGMLGLNAPEDLSFDDGFIYSSQHPKDRVAFEAVVAQAYLEQVSLSATGFYRTPNIYFDKLKGSGKPFYYFAYGAAVSEVEVDTFTGQWKLRQVEIVHDAGQSLNPLIDKGQIEGGFVQGMGWLTMEELVWDETGQLKTFAPSTYKIPTIAEIPEAFSTRLLERAPQEGVIYGSKAVGEPPFMLAISVREALKHAVASFGTGDLELAAPSTPEAILDAIDKVRQTTTVTGD
ncbi:MAG: xanthine dehydrogenase molybdopterin binding subunit [Trueperaceae bacterium]|nr:xanthine dehydrogenase molybdopterin binding subunit [Trueperaceae bacterium]